CGINFEIYYVFAFHHLPLHTLHTAPGNRKKHPCIAHFTAELFAHQPGVCTLPYKIGTFAKASEFGTCRSAYATILYIPYIRTLSEKIPHRMFAAEKYPVCFRQLFYSDLFEFDQALTLHVEAQTLQRSRKVVVLSEVARNKNFFRFHSDDCLVCMVGKSVGIVGFEIQLFRLFVPVVSHTQPQPEFLPVVIGFAVTVHAER